MLHLRILPWMPALTTANTICASIAFDFVEGLDSLSEVDEILAALKDAAEQLGFASFIVTGLPLPKRPLKPLVLLKSWPDEWFRRYIAQDYFRQDPVGQFALISSRPFRWHEVPGLNAAVLRQPVMGEAREFGLRDGYCVPINGNSGWQAAISFASDRPLDLSRRQLAAAHLIAVTAHGRIRMLLGGDASPSVRLTAREREVLTWAAAGKSAWETSCILGSSERTVIAHLENIRRKLNAANTTQAVAIALQAGDLQPF